MGLIHPTDLDAWQVWQADRHRLRNRLVALRGGQAQPSPLVLTVGGTRATVLVALDSHASSSVNAYVEPIRHLDQTATAVLDHEPRRDLVGEQAAVHHIIEPRDINQHLPELVSALSAGYYLRAGSLAHQAVTRVGGHSYVAQHGLLTPHVPPLPPGCTLLAWSQADADYWCSGRTDIDVQVVGSQLLWHAARRAQQPVDPAASPTFLGQLHGAEVPRRDMARVSYQFCRDHDATYRPHPSEVDKLSRLQHEIWKRRGVRFDTTGQPLAEIATPIVGVFSTGLLEAAAAGHPAYTYHPDPPPWVAELWKRYGLASWGSDPTPAPDQPAVEPAQAIARMLMAVS